MKYSGTIRAVVALASLVAAQLGAAETNKVLFLGNSITRHGPKPDIGWTGNFDMAATAEEKDFVHLVTAGLAKKWGAAPEVMVRNLAELERQYATYDVQEKLKEPAAFRADLIIVAIGENVPPFKDEDAQQQFAAKLREVLKHLKGERHPVLLVRSCFWPSTSKDKILREVCQETGGVFVDIGTIGKVEANYARSERTIAHAGVGSHPGDQGMKAIADAILAAISQQGKGSP